MGRVFLVAFDGQVEASATTAGKGVSPPFMKWQGLGLSFSKLTASDPRSFRTIHHVVLHHGESRHPLCLLWVPPAKLTQLSYMLQFVYRNRHVHFSATKR